MEGPCPACVTSTCTVTATADPTTLLCGGGDVNLTAVGEAQQPAMDNDFNGGSVGSGWSSNPGAADFSNPCGDGPNGSTDSHLWMGSGTERPKRTCSQKHFTSLVEEQSVLISDWLKMSTVKHPQIVKIRMNQTKGFISNIVTTVGYGWNTLNYFEPLTTQSGPLYEWEQLLLHFSSSSKPYRKRCTTMVSIRKYFWDVNDHWGVDNIVITPTPCAPYYYDWNVDGTTDNASITDKHHNHHYLGCDLHQWN